MKKLDMEEISRLILKAVKKFVVVDSTLIYYGRKKRRWTKLHVFYIRVPSYTDVASKKLKQDVESSWQCPFVSVSKEESEAQHAFCNVKKGKGGSDDEFPFMRLRGRFVWMLTRRS